MTLQMLDSVTPANLPHGAPAYLGYVGGLFITVPALRAMFPGAQVLDMAISAAEDATGCDCENGDLTPGQVPAWVRRQLARGVHRPVVYASASAMPGVLDGLAAAGIARAAVRVLTAHYDGRHICGPATCRLLAEAADGTQWTDQAPGLHGTRIDESLLADGFFATPPPKPAPAKKETHMILVQVGRASLPAGTPWPGVFLLTADGSLHHVTGPEGAVNNVESYKAAGIPGPVTITFAEYQARAGKS